MQNSASCPLLAEITDQAISLDRVVEAVKGDSVGGLTVFLGLVRDIDDGQQVRSLDYSAHPRAAEELAQVVHAVAGRHDVLALAAVHRVGHLRIGDTAVVVAAGAVHRGPAFAACRDVIDTLKQGVPIWKAQELAGGRTEWVGLP